MRPEVLLWALAYVVVFSLLIRLFDKWREQRATARAPLEESAAFETAQPSPAAAPPARAPVPAAATSSTPAAPPSRSNATSGGAHVPPTAAPAPTPAPAARAASPQPTVPAADSIAGRLVTPEPPRISRASVAATLPHAPPSAPTSPRPVAAGSPAAVNTSPAAAQPAPVATRPASPTGNAAPPQGPIKPSVAATLVPGAPRAVAKAEPVRVAAREPFVPAVAPSVAATLYRPASAASAPAEKIAAASSPPRAPVPRPIDRGPSQPVVPDVKSTLAPGVVFVQKTHRPPKIVDETPRFAGTRPDVRATLQPSATASFKVAPAAEAPPPVQTKTEPEPVTVPAAPAKSIRAFAIAAAQPPIAQATTSKREQPGTRLRVLHHGKAKLKTGSAVPDRQGRDAVLKAIETAAPMKPSQPKPHARLLVLDKTSGRRVIVGFGARKQLAPERLADRLSHLRRT